MMKSHVSRLLGFVALALVGACLSSAAFAGGPLYVYDPATKTPYSWPLGQAAVYTDLGKLGPLSNSEADAMTAFSWNQWNQVPTSTFHATLAGDFASIGLPDIDASNIFDVLGKWNGGGIHVVYDADGSIFESLFGFSGGVLGITIIEFVDADSPAILEATVILNGSVISTEVPAVEAAADFDGVVTHEFGHAVNLAHSQTNGQLVLFFDVNQNTFEPNTGAAGCPAPYGGFPEVSQMETMYPFSYLGYSGVAQSTVELLDDTAALSDLYPKPGWPGTTPKISGRVYWPDGKTQYIGANVIARNMANPFGDAISALSGDLSQGQAGPDGYYAFNGLTPGAQYALYLDGILAGAFSTPIQTVLPGPEEYYNTAESNDGLTDPRCQVTPIAGSVSSPRVADMEFNRVKGAPTFIPVPLPDSNTTGISGDGSVAVGGSANGVWRWTSATGVFEDIGGAPWSITPDVSENGKNIVGEVYRPDGLGVAGLWQGGKSWLELGGLPNSQPCGDGDWSSAWGVSDNRKVVGLAWNGCTEVSAYVWDRKSGVTGLGFLYDGSRANDVNVDGSRVVGWDRDPTGFWRGAQWVNGRESLFQQPAALCCNPADSWCPGTTTDVGSANGINALGTAVVGEGYQVEKTYVDPSTGDESHYCVPEAWRWTSTGGMQRLGDYFGRQTIANDTSNDAGVITGLAYPEDFFGFPTAILWTPSTGVMDFTSFLNAQGTYAQDWVLANAYRLSGDAQTAGGYASTPFGYQGWIVKMPKVVICHSNPANHSEQKTLDVDFPAGLPDHLGHGDTIGICGNGVY